MAIHHAGNGRSESHQIGIAGVYRLDDCTQTHYLCHTLDKGTQQGVGGCGACHGAGGGNDGEVIFDGFQHQAAVDLGHRHGRKGRNGNGHHLSIRQIIFIHQLFSNFKILLQAFHRGAVSRDVLVKVQEKQFQRLIGRDLAFIVRNGKIHAAGHYDLIIMLHQGQIGQQIIRAGAAGTGGGIIDPGVNHNTGHILRAVTDCPAAAKGTADLIRCRCQCQQAIEHIR